eukprot:TRINITY_DN576_c6_g1_i1.p1 TRINITY_DN576_c6_g1~~TRINITY_DN576_c6_g1_i1.p1  ORF type:complete len:251 (+),score=33.41 TRINITY_DN576_c6_g1_i1:35-787(+)
MQQKPKTKKKPDEGHDMQKVADKKKLNWTTVNTFSVHDSKSKLEKKHEDSLKHSISDKDLHHLENKSLKYLEDFWKKVTDKKDLKGLLDLSKAKFFWFIIWSSDFNPKRMAKDYDTYSDLFKTGPITLPEDNESMSDWFSFAWDHSHKGLLDFTSFCSGWTIATYGAKLFDRLKFLFLAFDRDNDSYINRDDIIYFCTKVFRTRTNLVTLKMIKATVEELFCSMNKEGPFDALSFEVRQQQRRLRLRLRR